MPKYSRPGDAGLDLFSVEEYLLKAGERRLFMLGIALEIETGNVLLVWDRSGLAAKFGIKTMGGVIDQTYRGEIGITLINTSDHNYMINKGDKIAQLLVQPIITAEIEEVGKLGETVRGSGAFGSSGKN